MKKSKILLLMLYVIALSVGCEKSSTEDEFIEVNGDVKEKLISKIEARDVYGEKTIVVFNYNGQNQISSISDGEETTTFNYNSQGELISTVTKNYPNDEPSLLNMSELYQAPYDVFDSGEVLEKDSNNNPIKILVYKNGYGSEILTVEIIYDDKPNPFFYTIKSSSMLDVLDKTYFNFGYQSPEIVKAKDLLPNNIFTGMIFKDSNGITTQEVQINYSYDDDDYPIQGDIYTYENGEAYNYYINYYYK
jgi:YD repeat-containing protein